MITLTRSDCRKVARLLQAWLDGESEAAASALVGRHLEACHACGLDADTFLAIRAALSAGRSTTIDRDAVERIRRFAEALAPPPTTSTDQETFS